MKRIFTKISAFVLAFSFCVCMAACSSSPTSSTSNSSSDNSSESGATQAGYDREELKSDFLSLADKVTVNETSVTFTDANGKSVTIDKNPKKVYNLYASFTTLWYEAGGSVAGCIGGSSSIDLYKQYIGRDITADEGVSVVATSSSGSKWSVEKIISGQPDLIICSTAMSGYSTISSPAEAAGIPVIAVNYDSFSDYLKWFKVFCNLTGKPELWDSIATKALDDVVEVLMEIPLENNPTVFCMFSGTTKFQANLSSTVVGSMVKMMRATNIADSWYTETGATRVDINLETVFAGQPDMILVQCHSDMESVTSLMNEQYGDNAVWKAIPAVQNEQIFFLEKALFHNKPNSRFAEAYQKLAQILYPDVQFSFMSEESNV